MTVRGNSKSTLNTMSVNASHTPHSLRIRRELTALERRGDAWRHDFKVAAARPVFPIPGQVSAPGGLKPSTHIGNL